MIKKMYSVYDVKSGVYGPLMLCLTDGEALRAAADTVNQPNNPNNVIAQHPEDFRLDYIGDFNMATGSIDSVNAPKHLIDCAQLKKVGA